MTLPGGGADKLGNRYEGLWTVREMLRVLDEKAISIAIERPGYEGAGVEFVLETDEGKVFYQVKRRNRDNWTLGALERNGVLKAFAEKLSDPTAKVFFASTHQADPLWNLAERARKSSTYEEFSALFSTSGMDADFEELRVKWGSCPHQTVWERLKRVWVTSTDETTLEGFLNSLLIDRIDGDPTAARVLLADYAVERMHEKAILATEIWTHLERHGFSRRAWHNDPRIISNMDQVTNRYIEAFHNQAIEGYWIERSEVRVLIERLIDPAARRCVILSGDAGIGKSGVVFEALREFKNLGWPVLAFRLDRIGNAETSYAVGVKLGLPESPSNVLAAVAHDHNAVLLIDQLDAVSLTSGRNPEFFECVLEMLHEALHRPNLRVVIACRRFDLHNDPRFRKLLHDKDGFASELEIQQLAPEHVTEVLQRFGIDPARFTSRQIGLLSSPLNLKLFAEGLHPGASPAPFESVNDLYATFWDSKQDAIRLKHDHAVNWGGAIDALCEQMSLTQSLSIPENHLDDLRYDWQAMASEGVLIQDGNRIAFFHEGFFDYSFARRFASKGGDLLAMLLSNEQHLFRRAQVRQVLVQERAVDFPRYLTDLERLLHNRQIRFHIRQGILALVGTLADPSEHEWGVISKLLEAPVAETKDVWMLIQNSKPWFELLDRLGVINLWLETGDELRLNHVIWMLQIAKSHSPARVAEMARPFLDVSEDWNNRLKALFRFNGITTDRGFFELFLDLLKRGGFEADDFWMLIHDLPKDRPDWACEAIGAYLSRSIEPTILAIDHNQSGLYSRIALPSSHHDGDIIKACAERAALAFVEIVLPFVERVAEKTVRSTGKPFEIDSVWGYRFLFGKRPDLLDNLLSGLVTALTVVANGSPAIFKTHFASLRELPLETFQFVLIRVLAGAPAMFADDSITFLCEHPERFQIGFSDGHEHASHNLLSAMTPHASEEVIAVLERTLLSYNPELARDLGDHKATSWKWHLREVGEAQLALLMGVSEARLTPIMRQKRQELERKFPNFKIVEPRVRGGMVGSPISRNAASKMTDDQWLSAMQEYAGENVRVWHVDHAIGGARQAAQTLEATVKTQPARFAELCLRMPDSLHSSYFDAILIGLEKAEIEPELVFAACRRCHTLPNRLCGRWMMRLITNFSKYDVPEDILELVAWYATNDPNPENEDWKIRRSESGSVPERSWDIQSDGINSVRGVAAETVGSLIFDDESRIEFFSLTLEHLLNDPSTAVRYCTAEALVGVLKYDRDRAVEMFLRLCNTEDALLATSSVEQFLWYATSTHFSQLEPLLQRMLVSGDAEVAQVAARLICVAAFDIPDAEPLAYKCLNGTTAQRCGAAEIYAANYKSSKFRRHCGTALAQLFNDGDQAVREKAADCFWRIPDDILESSTTLLEAFIASPAFENDSHLLYTLKDSAARIPDIILAVCEKFFNVSGEEAGDIRTGAAANAHLVSELVVRAYAQQLNATVPDAVMTRRSLDLIDQMLAVRMFEADKLLEIHER